MLSRKPCESHITYLDLWFTLDLVRDKIAVSLPQDENLNNKLKKSFLRKKKSWAVDLRSSILYVEALYCVRVRYRFNFDLVHGSVGLWTFSSISTRLWEVIAFFSPKWTPKTHVQISRLEQHICSTLIHSPFFPLTLCPKLYLFAGSQQGIENTNPYHSFSLTSRFISVVSGGRTNLSTCPFTVTNGTKTPPFYYKGAAYCRLQQVKKP